MDAASFFLQLALILIAARVFAEMAVRFGAPAVIGELLAGVLLGPSVLGWIEPTETIQMMAEIGIILLLFHTGIETDARRLIDAGPRAAITAVGGFVIPFLLGFTLSRFVFDHALLVALFIGGTLTATSIGVTIRILKDVNRQHSMEGQVVLGAAVIDDILGVLLLAVLYNFSRTGAFSLAQLGTITLYIGMFLIAAPVAAKIISFVIGGSYHHSRIPGLAATTIVSLVLLFAWLAHLIGAPELLGGFAAGLALSRRFFLPFGLVLKSNRKFRDEIEHGMEPIVHLFTPIFFVTVGLSLDLGAVDWSSPYIWIFSVVVATAAIVGKIAGAWLLTGDHWLVRTAIGMAMVPRGEVGLVFAELGRAAGVFDAATYTGIVLVIAYTTLFSPFWIKLFYRLYGRRAELADGEHPPDGNRRAGG